MSRRGQVQVRGAKSRRVVVLCFEDAELLDVTGPANVLSMASRLLRARGGYQLTLAAHSGGPVRTVGGVELHARQRVRDLRGPLDTLIVPGGPGVAGAIALLPDLRRLAHRARRIVGVCGGAFLLGEAGLLDGRSAVTHWAGCADLAKRYPRCRVEPDAIFIEDGRIWTSAGITAGMDLALALVEHDYGPELALEVARWLVMYLRRPGGQSQFSAPLSAQSAQSEPLRALVQWVLANLTEDLSVAALAHRAGMSERNFARSFVGQTGMTPAAWVQAVRLEAARNALQSSRCSVKEIAATAGFRNVETMHRAFQRELRVTPLEYRKRFGSSRTQLVATS